MIKTLAAAALLSLGLAETLSRRPQSPGLLPGLRQRPPNRCIMFIIMFITTIIITCTMRWRPPRRPPPRSKRPRGQIPHTEVRNARRPLLRLGASAMPRYARVWALRAMPEPPGVKGANLSRCRPVPVANQRFRPPMELTFGRQVRSFPPRV